MKIIVSHRLYNSFGGHKSISIVAELLEYKMPNIGDAIQELEITLHFFHDGPAKRSLQKTQDEFHEYLKSLPKCTFYRKKQCMKLEFEAKFATGFEIEKNKKPPIQINPDWVKSTFKEIINFLPLIKKKLKKSDRFDYERFEEHISTTLAEIPKNIDELENIRDIVAKRRKAAFDKLDDWEKLGLDWDNFHPNAKNVVPAPSLWSCTDEFSPNGNDTGADTLSFFLKWNKSNSDTTALAFLKKLLSDWDVEIDAPYKSDYSSLTYFQTVTGLAFASAKLRGKCEQELKDRAILAIDKYLESIKDIADWEHKKDCQYKLGLSKKVIEAMPIT